MVGGLQLLLLCSAMTGKLLLCTEMLPKQSMFGLSLNLLALLKILRQWK